MTITAVIVTFNRLELLKRGIGCLKSIPEIDTIIVVNNGSTDGTGEWLSTQEGIKVINQENVGGSGGFYRGIQEAYKDGADWIWCMDDDVFPRPDSLAELLKAADESTGILAPRRLLDGKPFVHEFQSYNFTNPFASMKGGKLAKLDVTETTEIVGTDFEGPLINRKVVEKIGLPNKDFFIFCDDTDYCLRAHLAGFKLKYVPTALLDKHKFFSDDTWASRNRKKKWKRYYQVRNVAYMNHNYGKNAAVRYLRSLIGVVGYIVPAVVTMPFTRAWSFSDIRKLINAYNDGVNHRLGKY